MDSMDKSRCVLKNTFSEAVVVPPFGAGFLYIGSGAVGDMPYVCNAVGVNCFFFL